MSDGKLRWANHGRLAAYFYMPSLTFNDQFTRIMAEIPETAPRDENHFLQTSTDVRHIQYGARSIRYETGGGGAGFEIFIVAQEPRAVKVDAVKLPRRGAASRLKGWHYDLTTQLLRMSHEGTKVEILIERIGPITLFSEHLGRLTRFLLPGLLKYPHQIATENFTDLFVGESVPHHLTCHIGQEAHPPHSLNPVPPFFGEIIRTQ